MNGDDLFIDLGNTLGVDCFYLTFGIDGYDFLFAIVVIDDRLGHLVEGVQTFFNSFRVVVRSTAGFSTLEHTGFHYFLFDLEIQQELHVADLVHLGNPSINVILTSWKSIEQENSLFVL